MSVDTLPFHFPSSMPRILMLRLKPVFSQPLHPLWSEFYRYAQNQGNFTLATCPYDAMAHLERAALHGRPYKLVIIADDGIMGLAHTHKVNKEAFSRRRRESLDWNRKENRVHPDDVTVWEELVISDDAASDDEAISQCGDGMPNDGLQFDDVLTDEDEISTMMSKMELKDQKQINAKPKHKLSVHNGCRSLRRMLQDLILKGCTVLTAFSFARYHDTEKMNSFFEEFGVPWTVGERRIELELKANEMYVKKDENGVSWDQRGLRTLPPTYPASFTLLRNVTLEENIYMTDDGSMSGLAMAPFGRGGLIYIGDDSLVMVEETAHLIVSLCNGEAPWLVGQGSGYDYREMKRVREESELGQALDDLERQERAQTKVEDFDHLSPDRSSKPDDINKIIEPEKKMDEKEEKPNEIAAKEIEELRKEKEQLRKEKEEWRKQEEELKETPKEIIVKKYEESSKEHEEFMATMNELIKEEEKQRELLTFNIEMMKETAAMRKDVLRSEEEDTRELLKLKKKIKLLDIAAKKKKESRKKEEELDRLLEKLRKQEEELRELRSRVSDKRET